MRFLVKTRLCIFLLTLALFASSSSSGRESQTRPRAPFPFAYVQNDCGPADGPALTFRFTLAEREQVWELRGTVYGYFDHRKSAHVCATGLSHTLWKYGARETLPETGPMRGSNFWHSAPGEVQQREDCVWGVRTPFPGRKYRKGQL